eukprot:GHRR01010032.1.p1 GENE.GHRR01010032.1~~GHRR01010032.1.p1  ORF type:complete len:208 (+),score=95.48 GHRR01010032.1:279-902(+)
MDQRDRKQHDGTADNDSEVHYRQDDNDSSDDEYNQKNFGIYQALPVDGEPDWSLDEPDSAEEYLRRVRYEAAQCPKVVRVEPAQQYAAKAQALPEPQAIAAASDWAKPDRSWVEKFVLDFQQLRLQVQQAYEQGDYPAADVPHMNDVDAWDRSCFGRLAQAESHDHLAAEHIRAAAGSELTQLTPGIFGKLMALQQVYDKCACPKPQ